MESMRVLAEIGSQGWSYIDGDELMRSIHLFFLSF